MNFAEEKIKSFLYGKISRGKVEVSVLVQNVAAISEKITVNKEVISEYITALREIKDEMNLTDNLSLSDVMRIPDAFTVVKAETDEEQLWDDLRSVLGAALDTFVRMRENARGYSFKTRGYREERERCRGAFAEDCRGLQKASLRQNVRGA